MKLITDPQLHYITKLASSSGMRPSLPGYTAITSKSISREEASLIIESLKTGKGIPVRFRDDNQIGNLNPTPGKSDPMPANHRMYNMLNDLHTMAQEARVHTQEAINLAAEADAKLVLILSRLEPTIEALYCKLFSEPEEVEEDDEVTRAYEEFLDDNEPELNYNLPADSPASLHATSSNGFDPEFDNLFRCPF